MATQVIHIKDAPEGWREDPRFVYIGRGSKWGNPWRIGSPHPNQPQRKMTRDDVCELFENLQLPELLEQVAELHGKVLVCYCHPKRCHGHSLARAADER